MKWLNLLINPGSSLGGARPKASVVDDKKNLWIAKFPAPVQAYCHIIEIYNSQMLFRFQVIIE
jgi:hypothetical protein